MRCSKRGKTGAGAVLREGKFAVVVSGFQSDNGLSMIFTLSSPSVLKNNNGYLMIDSSRISFCVAYHVAIFFPFCQFVAKSIWVIGLACGQDGGILTKFFLCVSMDRDKVEVHKHAKKRRRPISRHLDRASLVNKEYIV